MNFEAQNKKYQEEKLNMMSDMTNEFNRLRDRLNTLDLQSANNRTHVDSCRITVDHLETLVTRVQDRNETFRIELDGLRRSKLENKKFEKVTEKQGDEIKLIKVVLENTLNEFKSIENYTSK